METLKTAVIGTGNMGRHHTRIYSELENSELVGVADVNFPGELAEKFNTNAYSDYNEMLEKEHPDVVNVVVPTALHAKIGSDVLDKSNLLVEKPITLNVEEAELLIKKAKDNDKKLMVGQIERFNPVVKYLKNLNKDNYLSFNIMRLGPYTPQVRTTGVLMDMGIHDIDTLRFLIEEEPLYVHAACKHVNIKDFEDHAHLFMKFPSASASIVTNWISPRKVRHVYAVLTDAFIYANMVDQVIHIKEKNGDEGDPLKTEGPTKVVKLDKEEPLKNELEAFLECIEKNTPSPVSGKDALETLKVALAAEKIAYLEDPNEVV